MGLLDKLLRKEEKEEEVSSGPVDATGLFEHNIKDTRDVRTINESPQLQEAITDYQDPSNVEKREIFTFDSEMKRTPDFYLPYYWAATYNFDKGNFGEAKKILLDGINCCNIKSVLCRRLGEFYFLQGNVDDALYWFFTTTMADTGNIDFHSYNYLAYIFEVYGMKKASEWALRRVRGISYKLLFQSAEYSTKKKEKIQEIALKSKNERSAKKLSDFYRYAKPVLKEI